MRLPAMPYESQRRLIEIMRVIDEANKPIGAKAISDALGNRGYDIGERAVRYNLKILDDFGFTRKHGYFGRVITQLGMRELGDALVGGRIGFMNARIEECMYRITLDHSKMTQDVITNASLIDKSDCEETLEILSQVSSAGYSISRRVLIVDEEDRIASVEVPAGCLAILTVCSITIDGMLLKRGIPVNTRFAGVIKVQGGDPQVFTDLIAYAGSSLDPMKVFMARRMTRINEAVKEGTGRVLANVREIPISAVEDAFKLLKGAEVEGISGLIKIGRPSEPILGCPVESCKVGIALYAGVNGAVAVEESGIWIRTTPISEIVNYGWMTEMA